MPHGPQKIILIRSGRYDYAEVELSGTLQIVGPNNTGKTTLINTLQFLYLDDLRRMDFGAYTAAQTRAYYFPTQYSYILFQCLGSSGQCVIGWRGRSKTSGGDPERFAFGGPYEAADFFDSQNQVREPREVSARLARKDYRALKTAQEHRELLLQAATGDGRGLGIVSLRDPDRYPQFRESLKDLLSLSTISQDQMRNRLLMLADIPADRVALDARRLFGEDYDRIRQRRDALVRFKKHTARIEELVGKYAAREGVRGSLIYRWTDLRAKRQAFIAEHDKDLERLRRAKADAERRLSSLLQERQDRDAEKSGQLRQEGGLQTRLDRVAAQQKELAGFVEELARATLTNLQAETTRLQLKLAEAERESREKARQKIEVYRSLVGQKQKTIAHFDQLVVTALRRHFSDADLGLLFRLLSFDLLELRLGSDGAVVHNQAALLESLRGLLKRIRRDRYEDGTVATPLPVGTRTLDHLANPDAVRARLADEQETLDRWERILEAILQRETLEAQIRARETEATAKRTELIRFDEFKLALAELPRLRSELRAIQGSIAAAQARIDELDRQIQQAERDARDAEGGIRKAEEEFNRIENRFVDCRFPEFPAKPLPCEDIPNDFDTAISLFVREQGREEKLSAEVQLCLSRLETLFADRFTGADEADTVRSFQAELEALPEHEEALTRDWNAHIHSLKSGFDYVLKELSEVHSAKDHLNRDFARVRISNLKSIRVEILEAGELVGWIRRLATMDQPGLFDDNTKLDQTLANFRRILEDNPLVRYASLFTLRFTVVGDDEVPRHYQDFHQIESHGTTITVKVLFNLLVLKWLLRRDDSLVPFFLDEVQSLDPANRVAILTMARKLGFIAITAAPEAISEVDALYFLQPQRGRIVLTDKHRMVVKLRTPAPAPEEPTAK